MKSLSGRILACGPDWDDRLHRLLGAVVAEDLLDFIAACPIEAVEGFAPWHTESQIANRLGPAAHVLPGILATRSPFCTQLIIGDHHSAIG